MLDITNALSLFGVMFEVCFWASMMIVVVYFIKIVFVVFDSVKNIKLN